MAKNYKIKQNSFFINPYNYVSVKKNEKTKARKDYISGIINCSLDFITPLAIPDEVNENGEYPFFRIDGNPVIPASSIRGPIRSMYETVTNSCFSTTKDDDMLTTRYKPGGFKPGILVYDKEKNKWALYKADRYLIPIEGYIRFRNVRPIAKVERNKNDEKIVCDNHSFRFGDTVSAKYNNDKYSKQGDPVWLGVVEEIEKDDNNKMFIYLGEPFPDKKHGESLFVLKSQVVRDVDHKEIKGICETRKMYADDGINSKYGDTHFGYSGFDRAIKNGYIPIWYSDKGELSLAAVGRKAFNKNIASFAGEHCKIPKSEKKGVDNRNNIDKYLCSACALFGIAPYDSKFEGYGSKIRISDVIIENAKFSEGCVLLKELAKPRNSYLPFHSVNGIDYDRKGGAIRGRKFYWHNNNVNSDASIYKHTLDGKKELTDEEKKEVKRANKVELLMPKDECKGHFSVYFDDISVEELKKIMWTLTLGNDEKCGYKLGHGKPLGLGSVRINIESIIKKSVCDEYKLETIYTNSKDGITANTIVDQWENVFPSNDEVIMEVKKITSFNGPCKDFEIRYPYVVKANDYNQKTGNNDLASHHWFKQFKQNKKTLPGILEENQKLPVYELADDGEKKDNIIQGKISSLGKNKNYNEYGEITIGEKKIRFYAGPCKIYAKLKVGDIVTAEIRKNKNNDYYTAFNVQIIQDKN